MGAFLYPILYFHASESENIDNQNIMRIKAVKSFPRGECWVRVK